MITFEELISPLSSEQFYDEYLCRKPLAQSGTARSAYRLLSWEALEIIFKRHHKDCWLVKDGKLSSQHQRSEFQLGFLDAIRGFNSGQSIVVRHSEQAHQKIETLAASFFERFGKPVNIHVYATPAGNEGFNWHYDNEDVFVIQSSGQKEFYLIKNRELIPSALDSIPKNYEDLKQRSIGPEIHCLLKAGDFLYIPRGYWHKARAITDSFHLSIGVQIYESHMIC